MKKLFLIMGLQLVLSAAHATPQIAIRSISRCDTCHVAPTGWNDPTNVFERKCTLNCNSCHVSPTGGAMRNEAGRYYAEHTLPMFMARAADVDYERLKASLEVAASQPLVPASQPVAAGSQPMAAGSQPMAAGSQPTSRPVTTYAPELRVPAPGTAARYAGIEPHPTLQVGTDVRLALHRTLGDSGDTAFFPMQTDLMLAYRPYNPKAQNEGRVTVLVNAGFQGSRGDEFDGFADRAFVREWYAMYHDLPANLYVRAGRFLPAHGWRTDDHTYFTRQRQQLFGQNWDFERQVTGIEVGANPNYPYGHLSVFNPSDQWDKPIDPDQGIGTALTGGWRDLIWQAGGSLAYARKAGDQVVASGEWGLNLEVLTGLPLLYLGQYLINHRAPEEARSTTGLAAFHELDWWIVQGLNMRLRYDWADPDVEVEFDTNHQVTAGLDFYPIPFVELIAQYRHQWTNTEDRLELEGDALLFLLHAFY